MDSWIEEMEKLTAIYVTKTTIENIKNEFIRILLDNEDKIEEASNIDKEYNGSNNVDVKNLIKILEQYKDYEVKETKEVNKIFLSYYGDPYITINICMQAVINKTAIAISTNGMYALNEVMVELFNEILKEHKIKNIVGIFRKVSLENLVQKNNKFVQIICIGNSDTYYKYLRTNIERLKFIPYKNCVIYCDDENLLELQYELFKYACRNDYEIEMYEDMGLEEVIKCINLDKTIDTIIILTKSEDTKFEINEKISKKELYINSNPFKFEKLKIDIV